MFFWKKWSGRAGLRRSPSRASVGETQRRSYRAAIEFPIAYTVEGRRGPRAAIATELSAGGVRILGDEDLAQDAQLELRFALPSELVRTVPLDKEVVFGAITVRAAVVAAFFNLRRRKFVHGLRFVDIDEEAREEIQRFIHLWQLRVIRERAERRGD